MMLDIARTIVASLIIAAAASSPPASRAHQKPCPLEILLAAPERGKELLAAPHHYTYYAELTIQTVSQSDTITGKYNRFSQISFGREGNRQEKVLENTSTLPKGVYIDTSAANNLTRVYQFVITPETLSQYVVNVRFTGYKKVSAR